MSASNVIDAKANGVSADEPESTMTDPSPLPGFEISATIAPTTASEIATLRPTNTCGSAQRMRTFTNICHHDADNDRPSSDSSTGVELRPAIVATTIGKKQMSTTMTIFGLGPKPSHTTRSGASATFGTEFSATNSGIVARSIARTAASITATASPQTVAMPKPSNDS